MGRNELNLGGHLSVHLCEIVLTLHKAEVTNLGRPLRQLSAMEGLWARA